MPDSISTRVVMKVAEQNGVDHTDLPPLYTAIDSEALDSFFQHRTQENQRDRPSREIRFSYAGQEVTIRDGDVAVRPLSRQPETAAHD